MKEIILDTETTGISIKEGHRIVEIGCLELENLIPTKKNFHYYLNPGRKVSEDAFKVHGYSDDFLSSKKKFAEIADDFLEYIEGKRLIIHNSEFDIAHINNELSILGKESINNEIIDTLTLAREKFPGMSVSLDSLCKKFRIDNSRRIKHSALLDCDLLSKVYINLIDQKEPTLNFQENNNNQKSSNDLNVVYYKKIIKPNEAELKNHEIYLKKNLKKNYFN